MASHNKPDTEIICRTCLHFDEGKKLKSVVYVTTGYCRRYPPQIVFDSEVEAKDNAFPMVRVKDWCGEWTSSNPEDCEVPDEIA